MVGLQGWSICSELIVSPRSGSSFSTLNCSSQDPLVICEKFVTTVSPGNTGMVSPVTAWPVQETPEGSGTPE